MKTVVKRNFRKLIKLDLPENFSPNGGVYGEYHSDPLRRSTRQQERKEIICNTRSKPDDQNRNNEEIDNEGLEILKLATINVCTLAMHKDSYKRELDGNIIASLPEWLMIFKDLSLDIIAMQETRVPG